MVAFNFPSAPTPGQVYQNYSWDGEKWVSGASGAIYVNDPPPPNAPANSLWWNSANGTLYVRYNDGNSTQWVALLGGSGSAGAVLYDTVQTLSAAQKVQARANIDVLKKNYIVNGAMQVSQEIGSTPMSTGGYPVDMFIVTGNTAGTFTHVQAASLTPAGSPNRLRITVGTADAAVTANKYFIVQTKIEGLRMADLKFGAAAAKIITIQFGVKAPAGTYSVTLYNNAAVRTYAGEYTITAGEANTDVVKSVTLTADITGSWPSDNNGTLVLNWSLMCASNLAVAPGVWGVGAALGSTNQFNVFGTAGAVFELFDVGLYEGAVAPAFQVPDFTTELMLCQRYWEKTYDYATAVGTVTTAGVHQYTVLNPSSTLAVADARSYKVPKRGTPTVTPYSPATGASGKARDMSNSADITPQSIDAGANNYRAVLTPSVATANYNFQYHATYAARL